MKRLMMVAMSLALPLVLSAPALATPTSSTKNPPVRHTQKKHLKTRLHRKAAKTKKLAGKRANTRKVATRPASRQVTKKAAVRP